MNDKSIKAAGRLQVLSVVPECSRTHTRVLKPERIQMFTPVAGGTLQVLMSSVVLLAACKASWAGAVVQCVGFSTSLNPFTFTHIYKQVHGKIAQCSLVLKLASMTTFSRPNLMIFFFFPPNLQIDR